ncbi:MAG: phosphatidylglycerophosphatase A [Burkholderiales bacterium]|nr:phosphatidylglycerophosphatase A [Burkholderiales bacterium]
MVSTTSRPEGVRPTPAFMLAHPAHLLAMGFGTGLSPVAPGTVGTLLAIPFYAVLLQHFSPLEVLALCVLLFSTGIWACDRTGRDLGVADHGCMTWDEIVAFLAVLTFLPTTWQAQTAAFVLFRLFDVLKPAPLRWLEKRFEGGIGVMLDDLGAAFFTLLVLALATVLF